MDTLLGEFYVHIKDELFRVEFYEKLIDISSVFPGMPAEMTNLNVIKIDRLGITLPDVLDIYFSYSARHQGRL